MKPSKSQNYTLIGVGLGTVFPILAVTADLINDHLSPSFTNISALYGRGPLHWIILMAPLVLGLVFYFFDKVVKRREAALLGDQRRNEDQLRKLETFIADIERGDFSDRALDFDNQDLSRLLSSLRTKLINQKRDDEQARWVAEGHAKFGEVLRSTQDLTKLSEDVIIGLVNYIGVNQGSVFVKEHDEAGEEVLKLIAAFAYDRKKYVSKLIYPGDGLVGQCFLENETVILKKVPEDYIKITSGLGQSTASYVLIVPIKTDDATVGVLELASFEELESHQVAFVEKVCEGFASVIRSVQVASETKRLLEETQSQTEQLRLQEEEIRQNMEEMQATQEELGRQLDEAKMLKLRVERRERVMAMTTLLSETDLQGVIQYANSKFCDVAKYSLDELVGRPHNIVRHPDMPKELFRLLWNTIKRGEVFRGIIKNRAKDGSHYWVDATIVPLRDESGKVIKYVGSRYHILEDEVGLRLYNSQAKKYNWPTLADEVTQFQ